MGSNRTSFEKLQRERDKRARAEAKRARRQGRVPQDAEDDVEESGPDEPSETGQPGDGTTDEVLEAVARLHADFDADRVDFDTFEERKAELMARLTVD